MADENNPTDVTQAAVPLYWGETGGDPYSHYSNYFVVQITDYECFLTFFELRPELKVRNVNRSGAARDVAEIVIPKHLLPIFIKLLQDTYERAQQPATEKKE